MGCNTHPSDNRSGPDACRAHSTVSPASNILQSVHESGNLLHTVSNLVIKYDLRSTQPLIKACRSLAKDSELRIAVFGRFKAGKTSLLNHFLEMDLLPVGVIPVTSVLTEVGYGPEAQASVHFLDGHAEPTDLEKIRSFIAESENPGNAKRVASVQIDLPCLESVRGIRFVDTPGLESVLKHNTETTLAWLPNVDLALVAVGVDPPLSQHDIELIKNLYQYTPHVALLLTKVDTLNAAELVEVKAFISERLGSSLTEVPQILPYSVRPGFEQLRDNLAETVVLKTLTTLSESRAGIINRKIDKLLEECEGYLLVALRAASRSDAERELLRKSVLGDRDWIDEAKIQLKLIARHASEGSREIIARHLERCQPEIEQELIGELRSRFPGWARSLGCVIALFREWFNESLAARLQRVSVSNQEQIRAPIEKVRSELVHCLEDFRNRLSDSANRVLGVPLPRTDVEIWCLAPKKARHTNRPSVRPRMAVAGTAGADVSRQALD